MASRWSANGGSYSAPLVYAPHLEGYAYTEGPPFQLTAPYYAPPYPHYTSPQPPLSPRPSQPKHAFSSPHGHRGPYLRVGRHCPQQSCDEVSCMSQDFYGDITSSQDATANDEDMESDEQAVQGVKASFRRRNPDSKPERILRSLIRPKSTDAEYELDDDALSSIFSAVNAIFFNGRLTSRVNWTWSKPSDPEYNREIVGHTSFRKANHGGYETLITLSFPILTSPKYNRRLLISAFIHELIHCYLFVCCGLEARNCGGHTPGFHQIAKIIDNWAGPGMLHLCDMEADLEHFRVGSHAWTNQQRSPSPAHYHNRHKAEYGPSYRYPATVVSHSGSAYWEQPSCSGRWDYPVAPVARA
ncbi:uncharacterized protein E0L32_003329 [Thyridium curvatum]|uniref:SprT-like domain-containing protein n=1 Tax=Thyridium curvatum TaxID=1093900 RepID=A0A507BJI0_9PEZI|nr:uncharacterized protein E0L32_003329 [Thyridium curvatum]TPX17211.1 hypothetical protein E0L32_003329 [Thyridium curvatum]